MVRNSADGDPCIWLTQFIVSVCVITPSIQVAADAGAADKNKTTNAAVKLKYRFITNLL